MEFKTPKETKRSFAQDSRVRSYKVPYRSKVASPNKRMHRKKADFWPGNKLDYAFLEKCKEVVCRIPHPNAYYRHRGTEYRVTIMPWSRGSYLDIRTYVQGGPTGRGILLHLDIISAMLPEIIAAVRRMENEDGRDKKTPVEVIRA